MSKFGSKLALLAIIAISATAGGARAGFLTGSFNISVVEGQTYGSGFNATSTNPFAGYASVGLPTATATYTYTGALNLSNTNGASPDLNSSFGYTAGNLSSYSGSGTVTYNSSTVADYSSLASYLGSSGSASGFAYGSYYKIDLGVLSAGTVLTLTHDDGASIYQSGQMIGQTIYGPTGQVTDTVTLGATTDTILYYSRQNGAPSILQVTAPEPSSLAILIASVGGLFLIRRRASRAKL
jgi:hypothetical protein